MKKPRQNQALDRISIIIPVLNGAKTIAACINSLNNQNYPKHLYEIIVVDNGSSDGTSEIVKKFSNVNSSSIG